MIWRALLLEQARQDGALAVALAAVFDTSVDRVRIVDDAIDELDSASSGTAVIAERRPLRGGAHLAADVYLVDTSVERRAARSPDIEMVRQLAQHLDTAILTDDDGLDPSSFRRVAPDGSVEPVHLDDERLDEGVVAVTSPDASRSSVA